MPDVRPLGWLLDQRPRSSTAGVLRAGVDLSRVDLEAMRRDGLVVHVAADVYLPADVATAPSARVAAMRAVVPTDRVVGLLAAAWVHGVDAEIEPVEVLVPRSARLGCSPTWLHERETDVPASDVADVDGLRLTTPARTAADVARWLPADVARPVVGALLEQRTCADDVLAVLGQRRYRGAARARALVLGTSRGQAPRRPVSR